MKHLILAAATALLAAAPAHAQQAPATAAAELDRERLALATSVVAQVFPEGTYARMMDSSFEQMMDAMLASMFDLKATDLIPAGAQDDEERAKLANLSMREVLAACDPHFEERLSITNRVIYEALTPAITRMEPRVREALAQAYARRFTAEQLGEIDRFFATPSGRVYASEATMLWVSPEVTNLLSSLAPEIVRDMPAIMEKVRGATAHLPSPSRDEVEKAVKIARRD
jgi:hypothetical protein